MLEVLFGLHRAPGDLTLLNLAVRTVTVFATGIALVRLGARRELGRNAGFDIVVMVILGSVLSRGINGQAPFFPTLGASALLVGLHGLLSWMAARSHRISYWVKGRPVVLVKDGRIEHARLRQSDISLDDLEEGLRINGNVAQAAEVTEARLERNGEVSVIKKT